MPNVSFSTLTRGARQFVVQEALDIMVSSFLSNSWFTPITKVGMSSFAGAERTTFIAPAWMCFCSVSFVKNTPVQSITTSTSSDDQFKFSGSRMLLTRIFFPFTIKFSPFVLISCLNWPCVLSYFNKYAM